MGVDLVYLVHVSFDIVQESARILCMIMYARIVQTKARPGQLGFQG